MDLINPVSTVYPRRTDLPHLRPTSCRCHSPGARFQRARGCLRLRYPNLRCMLPPASRLTERQLHHPRRFSSRASGPRPQTQEHLFHLLSSRCHLGPWKPRVLGALLSAECCCKYQPSPCSIAGRTHSTEPAHDLQPSWFPDMVTHRHWANGSPGSCPPFIPPVNLQTHFTRLHSPHTALASALTVDSIAWYTHPLWVPSVRCEVYADSPAENGLHPTAYLWSRNG